MSQALPGTHLCKAHQGNHSHYAQENCELCRAQVEIERLRNDLADALDMRRGEGPTALSWLAAEIERLHEQVQDMIDASGQQCGCGYDKPDDVCLGHWPAYKKQQDKIERLKEAIIRAPCSQNRIPCRWPCDNDPADHGPCWKQAALNTEAQG